MIRKKTVVECDRCGVDVAVNGDDALQAQHLAERRNWRIVVLHYCGISAHFCPWCAVGKTDEELKEMAMKEGNHHDPHSR